MEHMLAGQDPDGRVVERSHAHTALFLILVWIRYRREFGVDVDLRF
jgi:hypothetical protein